MERRRFVKSLLATTGLIAPPYRPNRAAQFSTTTIGRNCGAPETGLEGQSAVKA